MHAIRPSRPLLLAALVALALAGCQRGGEPAATGTPAGDAGAPPSEEAPAPAASYGVQHAGDYATVPLEADLSAFDDDGKRMIALLVRASQVMDEIYWKQSWDGDREVLLARAPDTATRDWIELNFGPWEDRKSTRLNSSHVKNSYAVFCLKKKNNTLERRGGGERGSQ